MRDSNPRHPAPKAGALPDCANPRMSYHAVSFKSAHDTDRAGFRQRQLLRSFNIVQPFNFVCLPRLWNTDFLALLLAAGILFTHQRLTMNAACMPCPLCGSIDVSHFYQDSARNYLRCHACQLVFVPAQFHLSDIAEKAQYDLHQNNSADQGYRRFLGRLAEPLLMRLNGARRGLDFGCGPGPCLSVMLEEAGHSVSLYDLYYANDPRVLESHYDFITATEVVEHLANPRRELERLWALLRPGGYLGLMTKMVNNAETFATWHYKTDPTHISFFSQQSFDYLAQEWGAAVTFIGADVIIFQKSAAEH